MAIRDEILAIPDDILRNGEIAQTALVFMDFRTGAKRWWMGFGDLNHGGHDWLGTGDIISVSPISTDYQISARKVTFQMAPTAEMMQVALGSKDAYRDRTVIIYSQFFVVESRNQTMMYGTPLGPFFSMFAGKMMRMPWSVSGTDSRQISLECEGRFFRRNKPPRGRWTDAHQKALYGDDRGFERLPLYANGYESKWRT